MSVALVIPFYYLTDPERYAITKRVFAHYAWVSDFNNVEVYGVGSEGNLSYNLFKEYFDKWHYLEYEQCWDSVPSGGNDGLSDKFHESLKFAYHYSECDRIAIAGSDDVISSYYFDNMDDQSLYGLSGDYYIFDCLDNDNIYTFNGVELQRRYGTEFSTGAGLCFTRHLLELLEFEPFRFGGHEIGVERWCKENGVKLVGRRAMSYYHSFKTKTSLNSLDHFREMGLLR